MDVRVGREDGNSIAGLDTSSKETICEVLYPLCPFKSHIRNDMPACYIKNIPNGVRVEDGKLNIRMGKCKFLRVYLCRTQEKLERILGTKRAMEFPILIGATRQHTRG